MMLELRDGLQDLKMRCSPMAASFRHHCRPPPLTCGLTMPAFMGLQEFDVSMMYEDLAELELKLKRLIQQQQEEKAAAEAAQKSKLEGRGAGRPLIEVEAVGVEAN